MWSTTPRLVFRRLLGAVVVGVALAATSGCTVPVDAVAGISVTGDGHLLSFSGWGRCGDGQVGGSEAAVDQVGLELDSA
jgi:hypothetical protein